MTPLLALVGPAVMSASPHRTVSSAGTSFAVQSAGHSTSPGARPGDPAAVRAGARVTSTGGPASRSAHPWFAGENNWFNVTASMGYGPAGFAGMMAFDPLLGAQGGEMVYFGGCDAGTGCLTNATWLYDGISWSEVTTGPAPQAVDFGMIAYDPALGGILLVGGLNGSGGSVAQIWEYSSVGWTNLSGTTWATGMPPFGLARSSMAWDPELGTMLLVDGCDGPSCAAEFEAAWGINATGWALLPAPLDHLEGAGMAWDAVDGVMVLFGGDFGGTARNSTWIFNGTAWYLLAIPPSACAPLCETPWAMSYPSMTWDSQLDSVLLFGGLNLSTDEPYNDTWTLSLQTGWFNTTGFDSFANPPGTYFPTMALDSTDQAPLLIEGGCTLLLSSTCLGEEQVFDYAPDPQAAPNLTLQADTTGAAILSYSEPVDFGSGPWEYVAIEFGDGSTASYNADFLANASGFAVTFPHIYAATGTYQVNLSVVDFFYVTGSLDLNVTVVPGPQATASGLPSPTEVGTAVQFTSNLTLGTPPYAYDWSFGDGALANNSSANHSYRFPGNYTVGFSGSDALGASVQVTFVVRVYPQLTAFVREHFQAIDAGVVESFSASVSGGSGIYSPLGWSFGDGSTSTGASANHTYLTPGSYSPSFGVSDSLGFQLPVQLALAVNAALSVIPQFTPSSPSPGAEVALSAGVTGGTAPLTYSWVLGDGRSATGSQVTHAYLSAGTYTVYLWVNDSGGGSVEKSFQVSVSSGGGSSTSSGLPGGGVLLYGLVGAVVAAVVVVALLLARRRKPPAVAAGPASPPAPPPWSEAPTPPPQIP